MNSTEMDEHASIALDQAKTKAQNAGNVAIVLSIISAVFFVIQTLESKNLTFHLDPINYMSFMIYLGSAFSLYRISRFGAATLLVVFASAQISFFIEYGLHITQFLSAVAFVFIISGIYGTFYYHFKMKKLDSSYKAAPKWSYYLGTLIVIITIALFIIGIMLNEGKLNDGKFRHGMDLLAEEKQYLKEYNIISDDEKIYKFYSTDISGIENNGNILSNKRVIVYQTEGHHLTIEFIKLEDILDIQVIQSLEGINTLIMIKSEDKELLMNLSAMDNGDNEFIDNLNLILSQMDNK
ncbi:MAG: hypothetical protein L3J52_02915 [Proteobacteria bacterium]|nr:hypothetical protein [Pseudomonadota bacterium]